MKSTTEQIETLRQNLLDVQARRPYTDRGRRQQQLEARSIEKQIANLLSYEEKRLNGILSCYQGCTG